MRYSKEHKARTRRALIDAAGRVFRENGEAGSGVDAVATAAGVTSGAVYRQFGSKDDLFETVVADGMDRLVDFLAASRNKGGDAWIRDVIDFYVGKKHVGDPGGGCLLPTLSLDVSREGAGSRDAYNEGLARALAVITGDRAASDMTETRAAHLLASLLGAVILSRATGNDALRQDLQKALLAQFGAEK